MLTLTVSGVSGGDTETKIKKIIEDLQGIRLVQFNKEDEIRIEFDQFVIDEKQIETALKNEGFETTRLY